MRTLDEIDRKLLNILQNDSSITVRELSDKLHLSTTPIHERIKKLRRSGYIKKYIALVDPKLVDKKLIVYLSVLLNKHTKGVIDNFESSVNKLDEVMECYYVSGNADFLLKVYCSDMDDYHNFITHKFSVLENINQFYSSFVLAESKVSHAFKL